MPVGLPAILFDSPCSPIRLSGSLYPTISFRIISILFISILTLHFLDLKSIIITDVILLIWHSIKVNDVAFFFNLGISIDH
jgi:hypothetical protein